MTKVIAIASGVDPAEVRRLVQRIEQLEAMLAEQAERHTAELAAKDAAIEQAKRERDELARQVRVYELADEQEDD